MGNPYEPLSPATETNPSGPNGHAPEQAEQDQQSERFEPGEPHAFESLPEPFAPLSAAMQIRGRKAYQEAISHLLLEDVLQCR